MENKQEETHTMESMAHVLEKIQEMIPQIDLEIERDGNTTKLRAPYFNEWGVYLEAMDLISKTLVEEISQLPDVEKVNEPYATARALRDFILAFQVFYLDMEEKLSQINKNNKGEEDV